MFVTQGDRRAGWLPHHPIFLALFFFLVKIFLNGILKQFPFFSRFRPKGFHMKVLVTEYCIHIGCVVSLSSQEVWKHQLSLLH